MIASLRGTVAAVTLDTVVLEVGGVGMAVHTTPGTTGSARLGQEMRLATSLVVREDSLTLFGFASDDEKALFELVQTVSGVGPRLALAMLAVHDPAALSAAISSGNVTALTKVPGIGKKGAERIVLELRDKVASLSGGDGSLPLMPSASPSAADPQIVEALTGLGWTSKQAEAAVAKVSKLPEAQEASTSSLLRLALRELGR